MESERTKDAPKTPSSKEALPSSYSSKHPIIDSILPHGTSVDRTTDDNTLLDVHIGNPLRRITELLEEIKKQKAFSFTLKGSLGIAGIALVITTFGIFGGTKAFCSKGEQSHVGTLKELSITDGSDTPYIVERAQVIWDALTGKDTDRRPRKRVVLITNGQDALHVKERVLNLSLSSFTAPVIVTGDFDSCSKTLTIKDINGVEEY